MTKLQRLRNRALKLLLDNADSSVPMLIDYDIDEFLRIKLGLPDRPETTPPYEGWLRDEVAEAKELVTSQVGIDLIKRWEGFRSKAYLCPANVWTIGFGHTVGVKRGDRITRLKAEVLLKQDLRIYEKAVRQSVKVPLSQNQFDALVSFCYNVGTGAFTGSTLVKLLNQKHYTSVPEQLSRWCRAGKRVLPGLVSRRKAEGELFSL